MKVVLVAETFEMVGNRAKVGSQVGLLSCLVEAGGKKTRREAGGSLI